MERRPLELLILLVERHPHLVPRAEIADRLWGRDVFVDVDTGVNMRFERCGGRLAIRAITRCTSPGCRAKDIDSWRRWRRTPSRGVTRLAVLPFENLTGDPGREYLVDGFTEEAIAVLGQIDPERLVVVGLDIGDGLQADDDSASQDRPGARRRGPAGELRSRGRRTGPRHITPDSRCRSGAALVGSVRRRTREHDRVRAGTVRRTGGADPYADCAAPNRSP